MVVHICMKITNAESIGCDGWNSLPQTQSRDMTLSTMAADAQEIGDRRRYISAQTDVVVCGQQTQPICGLQQTSCCWVQPSAMTTPSCSALTPACSRHRCRLPCRTASSCRFITPQRIPRRMNDRAWIINQPACLLSSFRCFGFTVNGLNTPVRHPRASSYTPIASQLRSPVLFTAAAAAVSYSGDSAAEWHVADQYYRWLMNDARRIQEWQFAVDDLHDWSTVAKKMTGNCRH